MVVVALARRWLLRWLVPTAGRLKQLGQGVDVDLGHLQGLVLGQLFILAPLGYHPAQAVEGRVETLHAAALARVGR